MSTLYPQDKNPGIALYELWHTLLSAQGDLSRPSMREFPNSTAQKPGQAYGWGHGNWSFVKPKFALGDKGTAISVEEYDDSNRPILVFGQWYRRHYGLYGYMSVRADGAFRVYHPHGDNHNRIERNTFLGYGHRARKYVWYVSLSHTPGQLLDVRDFRTRVPYLREDTLRGGQNHYRPNLREWLVLNKFDEGWKIGAEDPASLRQEYIDRDYTFAERGYKRAERVYYAALGQKVPNLSVRSGKTIYTDQEAVRQIAAVLDVSQPAKVSPRPKIAEEAMA